MQLTHSIITNPHHHLQGVAALKRKEEKEAEKEAEKKKQEAEEDGDDDNFGDADDTMDHVDEDEGYYSESHHDVDWNDGELQQPAKRSRR